MTDLVPERLHEALSDLAEEVEIVDLHERALRTSRRLGARRVAVTALAVAALVALTAAGAKAVIPAKHGPPAPPAASGSVTPAPTATGSPSPEATPAPEGSAGVSAAPPPAGGTAFGTRVYYDPSNTRTTGLVVAWAPGRPQVTTVFSALPEGDAEANVNVSPDRRWLSYVATMAPDSPLHLVDLHTGKDRVLRTKVDGLCVEPAWAPDSRRLLISDRSGSESRDGVLDVTTGVFTPFTANPAGCHATWAVDGSAIVYANGSGKIFIVDPDGRNQRWVPHLGDPGAPMSFDLSSVAPGGTRMACYLHQPGATAVGDVARGLFANAVVDTRTGQKVTLPISGQLLQAVFRPDGSLIARVKGQAHHQFVLISATGTVLDRADEPAQLRDMIMLTT
jgi:hypothetical protein